MQSGLIFDIKRYSINDGPGIRITIFLKGCSLNCRWCHNPESISPQVQKLYSLSRCIHCAACVYSCPVAACELTDKGVVTDWQRCTLCGKCAAICPTKALEMSGEFRSSAAILLEIEKETTFIDNSDGGVTFSGGEPLLQAEFLSEILTLCGERGIHRAVDTAGLVARQTLLDVARQTDLFLYDLKLIDSQRHKQWTGADNQLILDNLRALSATGQAIQIRVPLIGGVNIDSENIAGIAAFVAGLPQPVTGVSLLPYHGIAAGKHSRLGQRYEEGTMREPTASEIEQIQTIFTRHKLTATVGG